MKTNSKTFKEIMRELNIELYLSINTEDKEYMDLLIDVAEYQCKRIYEEEKNEQLNYAHQLIVDWKKNLEKEYYYFILQLVDCIECYE